METKTSFILHLDSLKVLDSLTKEQIADLFLAIRDYNLGAEIKLEGLMKAIFVSFENQFERDNGRYLSVIERNRINGMKGGRPKTQTNPENPVGYLGYSENPLEPKKPDNDSDSDNDNDKDKRNNIVEKSTKKLELPFDGFDFIDAWSKLVKMPKWRKKPKASLQMALKKLKAYDEEFATQLIESAIQGNYQGLVFANTNENYKNYKNATNRKSNGDAGEDRKREIERKAREADYRFANGLQNPDWNLPTI